MMMLLDSSRFRTASESMEGFSRMLGLDNNDNNHHHHYSPSSSASSQHSSRRGSGNVFLSHARLLNTQSSPSMVSASGLSNSGSAHDLSSRGDDDTAPLSRRSSQHSDYRQIFETAHNRLLAEMNACQGESLALKLRLLEPHPLRSRVSLSLLHYEHLRPVPPAVLPSGGRSCHLHLVTGPPHEYVCGWRFNPPIRLILRDREGVPLPRAWCAGIKVRAHLINGVGDIQLENYDYTNPLVGAEAPLLDSGVTFDNLRVSCPSNRVKCGWFRLAFTVVDYAVEPVLSDRFEVAEARVPRDALYLIDDDYAEAVTFAKPSDPAGSRRVSPLMVAVARGQVELVQLMLDKGDRVGPLGPLGLTALHYAAYLGNMDILKTLVARGADVTASTETGGYTPLHVAILGGQVDAAKYLISLPATDPLAETDSTLVPAHLAARVNSPRVLQALGRGSVDYVCRRDRQTALHIAAFHGWLDCLGPLLSAGLKINQPAKGGWTPMHLAVLGGELPFVEALHQAGAELSPTLEGSGITPLHLAAYRGHEHIVKFLLDAGCSLTAAMANGWTAAAMAACSGDRDTLQTILSAGPDLSNNEVDSLAAVYISKDTFSRINQVQGGQEIWDIVSTLINI